MFPRFIIPAAALLLFLGFGLSHLGNFETTDEHLWKYDRIGAYWEAWRTGDWQATYINDKPGITVALVSGLGLLAEPDPGANERRALPPEEAKLYEAYRAEASPLTNIHFRLPVLVASTLVLLLAFYLLWRVFGSLLPATAITVLLATQPILLGMAQIINPDSFFWLFGLLATIGYLGWLWHGSRGYVVVTGLALGLALLSKYTAFLLVPLFMLLSLGTLLFWSGARNELTRQWFSRELLAWISLLGLATLLFFLLLPAAWLDPSLFFKGLSQFFLMKQWPYWLAGGGILALTLGAFWYFGSDARLRQLQAWLIRFRYALATPVLAILGTLFLLSLINAWSGQALVPVDALRDAAYANEPQAFNFRPVLDKNAPLLEKHFSYILLESAPLFFSLSPIMLALLILGGLGFRQTWLSDTTKSVLFAVLSFTLLYFAAAISAGVVTNARYLILLYPLLGVALGLTLSDGIAYLAERWNARRLLAPLILAAILVSGTLTLAEIRPFYFSYTNVLLPLDQSIHDSWGHGSYEAASYLNNLPEAERLVIWSNSDTVCRFFVGKCLRSRRIDLAATVPDYLVMGKRGVTKVRNQPIFENNPRPDRDATYYIQKLDADPDWRLDILGRPDNFIGIVKVEHQ